MGMKYKKLITVSKEGASAGMVKCFPYAEFAFEACGRLNSFLSVTAAKDRFSRLF